MENLERQENKTKRETDQLKTYWNKCIERQNYFEEN